MEPGEAKKYLEGSIGIADFELFQQGTISERLQNAMNDLGVAEISLSYAGQGKLLDASQVVIDVLAMHSPDWTPAVAETVVPVVEPVAEPVTETVAEPVVEDGTGEVVA